MNEGKSVSARRRAEEIYAEREKSGSANDVGTSVLDFSELLQKGWPHAGEVRRAKTLSHAFT